jgi:hypothetical protein
MGADSAAPFGVTLGQLVGFVKVRGGYGSPAVAEVAFGMRLPVLITGAHLCFVKVRGAHGFSWVIEVGSPPYAATRSR